MKDKTTKTALIVLFLLALLSVYCDYRCDTPPASNHSTVNDTITLRTIHIHKF